uniref:isochorismatase family cysteine hydrolase n=1 Tax=Castellaniella defragrans TaxID=75697 RepID=UPI003340C66F
MIVDVQNGFISRSTEHIPALVESAQKDYDVVYATRFYNPTGSFFRTLIKWNRLGRDSSEFALAFRLEVGGTIIDKPIYTCVDKLFVAGLRGQNISVVDVCGIDTDICVTKCAVDLFESGIEPRVLARLCASNAGQEAHEHALRTLERYIGKGQVIR